MGGRLVSIRSLVAKMYRRRQSQLDLELCQHFGTKRHHPNERHKEEGEENSQIPSAGRDDTEHFLLHQNLEAWRTLFAWENVTSVLLWGALFFKRHLTTVIIQPKIR
jgi:hypothetical protein